MLKRSKIFYASVLSIILMLATYVLPANAKGGNVIIPEPAAGHLVTVEYAVTEVLKMQEKATAWESLELDELRLLQKIYDDNNVTAASGFALDTDKVTGWKIDNNLKVFRVPFSTGQGILSISSLQIFFDGNNNLLDIVEYNFVPYSAESGAVQSWHNGELVLNQVIVAPENSRSSYDNELILPEYKRGDWWGNFNECLTNAGIPSWVISGISIACSVICAATFGVGCAVCLGAITGVWGGTIAGCILVANDQT